MVAVNYEDLWLAFDYVSAGAQMEHAACIDRDTGTIHWIGGMDEDERELPEDLDDPDRYIWLPHKNEFDLGKVLVFRFIAEELPHRFSTVEDFFYRRGAYSRLRELLVDEGMLESWYAFEKAETEAARRNWCRENGITLINKMRESTI